jgi:ABC-type cobalt transport system substrate-binding protein
MKKFRSEKLEVRNIKWAVVLCTILLLTSHFSLPTSLPAAEWSGVDETVVEKYAEEHGRAARDPVINTDQGDLLLFMFLIGGAVGGFIAGYYWRYLTEGKDRNHLKNAAHKKQAETTDGGL